MSIIGPDEKRLIYNLWVRGWSAREIANYLHGGVYAPIETVYAVMRLTQKGI